MHLFTLKKKKKGKEEFIPHAAHASSLQMSPSSHVSQTSADTHVPPLAEQDMDVCHPHREHLEGRVHSSESQHVRERDSVILLPDIQEMQFGCCSVGICVGIYKTF